jgi:predicted Zn-dependent peptidase
MKGVSSVTVMAMVGVGSRYEPVASAGMAHMLEHMVFKGTNNYPTAMDISTAIDGVGGQYNAFTGKDYTGFYVKVASNKINLALDVISDMLLVPKLRGDDIEREKGVIIEEINMYEDDPRRKVGDNYDLVVYGESPLGREIIGSKQTVNSITSQKLQGFLDDWYDFDNVVLVLTGDASKLKNKNIELLSQVEKFFSKGSERAGGGQRHHGIPAQTKPRLSVFYKKTEQAHFHLGVPGLKRGHKDRYILSVLGTVLGGNSSARLFSEIREKRGLAYYAYASASSYADTGSIYAFEGVAPGSISDAIKVTIEQFAAVGTKDLKKAEVDRAKDFLIGKLILDWEDSHNVAMLYAKRLATENKTETPDQVLKQIKAVTRQQVQDLAQRLFNPNKFNLALIGPYKDKERFEKLLKA